MEAAHPTLLESISAWVLVVSFAISVSYEFWRAVAKTGVSRYDSMRAFMQGLWLYVIAAIVIALLFLGIPFAAWVGLVFSVLVIAASIFYYNPTMMLPRKPGLIDWIEDLVYTGLAFVVAALLLLEVSGCTLV
ncbi:hypothetical protein ACDF64_05015 [Agromyces sp. MMS24-JH15]|uniref:hypothetical protein n=1 Tax=Agromyces sp. MMS24-JH15 TaxID=3243765 RepID=UPI00374932AA